MDKCCTALQLEVSPHCVPMCILSLQVYRILGQTVVFYPTDSMADFYTSFDVMILIDTLKVLSSKEHLY